MTTGRCRSFKHPKHTNTVLGVNPAPTAEFAPLARLGSELRDAPKRQKKRQRRSWQRRVYGQITTKRKNKTSGVKYTKLGKEVNVYKVKELKWQST